MAVVSHTSMKHATSLLAKNAPREITGSILRMMPSGLRHAIIRRMMENPYSWFNDWYRCIFIHVPKCAGLSVVEALFGERVGHTPLRRYQYYDYERFIQYTKAAFVRNPWDRLVSAYHFLDHGGLTKTDSLWAQSYLSDVECFEEFVLALRSQSFRKDITKYYHFRPQTEFLTNWNNNICLDFIGRYESLHDDFHELSTVLGVDAVLQHKNPSVRSKSYKAYYSIKTAEIVYDVYQRDVEELGYTFD